MKKMVCAALLVSAAACGQARAPEPELKTDEQKVLYALGLVVSDNLSMFNLTEAELEVVKAGLSDGVLRRDRKVDLATFGPRIQDMAKSRAAAGAENDKAAGTTFLAKAASEGGAVKAPSGFVIKEIEPGKGPSPVATDKVKVHYKGTLIDGTVFDSSIERGEPAVFPLNGVIPCWTQGLQMMKVGGKSRLVCPPDLAYGDRGAAPRIKPGATLVFEVELLEIVK
jgi:FKBP-type peptidyl-prolyl cis-trans isomerase FkpA